MQSELPKLFQNIGALSLFALLTTHCAAQSGDPAGGNESTGSDPTSAESVAQTESAITHNCTGTYNLGAFSPPVTTVVPIGCSRTAPGHHRLTYVVSQTGLVNCIPLQFMTQNPRDGRVLAYVQSANNVAGSCTITVVSESTCAHSLCAEGGPLDANCSPNVAAVCNDRPTCCTSWWDPTCVSKVATVAEESCS